MVSMLKGWGLDPYAISPYGSSLTGIGISFHAAIALSTNSVEVRLTGEALHISPSAPGDALNPATWTVQNLNTLEFLNVVAVEAYTPIIYILTILQALGPISDVHRVSSSTLLDVSGTICTNPRHADFAGIVEEAVTQDQLAAKAGQTGRDIANPQLPITGMGIIGGTLKVSADGDYESVTGTELVKKLIIRRLITTPGEFFHLPDYGLGLRLKEPMPVAELVRLKNEVERQVKREPEVQEANASITAQSNGILLVQLRARLQSGQPLDISIPVPVASVAL